MFIESSMLFVSIFLLLGLTSAAPQNYDYQAPTGSVSSIEGGTGAQQGQGQTQQLRQPFQQYQQYQQMQNQQQPQEVSNQLSDQSTQEQYQANLPQFAASLINANTEGNTIQQNPPVGNDLQNEQNSQNYQLSNQFFQPNAQPAVTSLPSPIDSSPATSSSRPVHYNKEFFFLSAPQEDNEEPIDLDDFPKYQKKHLRVVFIKAPTFNGLSTAALQLAKQSMEAKTAIYVLTKQHTAADLADKLQQARLRSPSKPEVVFVKYRTNEEAAHAQRTIQAQYEQLEGPNNYHFEGSTDTQYSIDPRTVKVRRNT